MEKKDLRKSIKKELKRINVKKTNYGWLFKIIVIAFFLSLTFSYFSETYLPKVNPILGIVILMLFIIVGIIFDLIGVAVSVADEKPFHSMNSRKVVSADVACLLKKNSEKVSAFCCDVIGDICGVISGTTGAIMAISISSSFSIDPFLTALITTAIISSITIGGKAIGKSFAINKSNYILYEFAKAISKVYRIKK